MHHSAIVSLLLDSGLFCWVVLLKIALQSLGYFLQNEDFYFDTKYIYSLMKDFKCIILS